LLQELAEVEQAAQAALADLTMPFARLVQNQWRRNFPLVRAAFVLTAGSSDDVASAGDEALRRQRVYLGAAIETLRLALGVHTQLLAGDGQVALDRSLLGSVILAGDFCFSRSAGLAAKTGSPVVVDLFAVALQRVSEGTLRGLFHSGEPLFDQDRDLCLSGVAAANELAGLSSQQRSFDEAVAAHLLDLPAGSPTSLGDAFGASSVTSARIGRWQALAQWLQTLSRETPRTA
jgi:octaprenyl-diphosphate synthase